jgi:hypothetical protein
LEVRGTVFEFLAEFGDDMVCGDDVVALLQPNMDSRPASGLRGRFVRAADQNAAAMTVSAASGSLEVCDAAIPLCLR